MVPTRSRTGSVGHNLRNQLMSKKSTPKVTKTDIGPADKLTMDNFIRTVVGQMFDNDNNIATLEVVLNGTDAKKAPKLEFELKLISINGTKTRTE